jgi:hypothetical protein
MVERKKAVLIVGISTYLTRTYLNALISYRTVKLADTCFDVS